MTQACCFSLQTYISLLSWRESPCLMLIQNPSLAPSDSHSFLTHWQMENATLFLRNVRGKCNVLGWPMHCNLSDPTLFPGTLVNSHEHRALGGRSSRSALTSSCSRLCMPETQPHRWILPEVDTPKHRWAMCCDYGGFRIPRGPQRRIQPWNHGNTVPPWPLLPSMFLVPVPTLPLFLLLLSSTPHRFFLEKKHCSVIRSTIQNLYA